MRPLEHRSDAGPAVVPMRRLKSGVLGLLAAVLVASLVAGTTVFATYRGLGDLPRSFTMALSITPFVLPFALPAILVVAVPILMLLRRFGWHRAPAYGLAGALAGPLVAWLGLATIGGYREFFGEDSAMRDIAGWYGAGALGGLASALTFWVIHRPDRAARGHA